MTCLGKKGKPTTVFNIFSDNTPRTESCSYHWADGSNFVRPIVHASNLSETGSPLLVFAGKGTVDSAGAETNGYSPVIFVDKG